MKSNIAVSAHVSGITFYFMGGTHFANPSRIFFPPLLEFSRSCIFLGLQKALVDGETLKHAERRMTKVLDLTHPSSVPPPFPVPRRDQQHTQNFSILFFSY